MKKKWILVLLCIFLVLFGLNYMYKNQVTDIPVIEGYNVYEPENMDKWIEEANLNQNKSNTVLIGDSITRYIKNYDLDIDDNINLGLPGATSYDVYSSIEETYFSLDTEEIDKVIITLGTNDWVINDQYDEYDSDFTVDCINAIVEKIYQDNNSIDIYVVTPFHVTYFEGSVYDSESVAAQRNIYIDNISESLENNLTKKANLININEEIDTEDGQIKSEYVKDGLHPNELGYNVIIPLIENEINN